MVRKVCVRHAGKPQGVTQMKPKTKPMKQGLTTEKVSRMLGVSITTVKRYFDRGTLTGWKDPTTGRMVIDPKSVKTFVAFNREWASTVRKAVDDFAGR